jgi:hypothetical protein
MGYRWKLGKAQKVRFWENVLVANSSLAIPFWELYVIMNEQNKTVAELWDGCNLKCTFRRCVDSRLFNLLAEVLGIASIINLSHEEDEPIWQFSLLGCLFSPFLI